MGIEDHHISALRRVLSLLSWDRLFKVGVIAILAIILVLGWLARGVVFDQKPPPNFSKVSVLKISQPIRNEIDDVVKKQDIILGIQVVTINFQKNIRTETLMSMDSPALQAIYNRFVNNKVVETALFDESKVNNNRIIRLINGEFVCVPFREATAYKYAPDAESLVSTVCAIGIPPSYGEFSGIITIYLKDKPNKDLTEQLFLLSRTLSIKIYEENKLDDSKKQH